MANVYVSTEDLRRLQQGLERNAGRFDELRSILENSIASANNEWQDEKFEEFQAIYHGESKPALEGISEIMRTFSKTDLEKKIQILERYHRTSVM